jgi:hypothetical protein
MSGDPRRGRQHALGRRKTLPSANAFSDLAKSWLRLALDLEPIELLLEQLHASERGDRR